MKLLITTQAVDRDDPVLGFFHGWLVEFSTHFESIEVICLREGTHQLPKNVHVYSLGKEHGVSTFGHILRFYKYLWQLRKKTDAIFSHMNPHYIVLGGFIWRVWGKPMFFWRNHAKMNVMTWIAAQFSKNVFYTSPYACTARFKHAVQMPVGIDTKTFYEHTEIQRDKKTILFLGRLSPVKQPELFLDAVKELTDYKVLVYGDDPSRSGSYGDRLRNRAGANTTFYGFVVNTKTPEVYSSSEIYVNLTPKGSMDKAILEAAACGALILVSNDSLKDSIPSDLFLAVATPETIRERIKFLEVLDQEKKDVYRKLLRELVKREHSLERLGQMLSKHITYA